MEKLRAYLNSLKPAEQTAFADRCDTTVGYLRKAISVGQQLNLETVIKIERESDGAVRCEDLRADIDWEYLRQRSVTEGTDLARIAS